MQAKKSSLDNRHTLETLGAWFQRSQESDDHNEENYRKFLVFQSV